MTSYLLISDIKEAGFTKALEICQEKKISPFDRTIFDISEFDVKGTPKKSWGVQDVKEIRKKIYLKPLQGSFKAVIIKDAHLLTIEAQNALLKVLEEPPPGTLLILISDNEDAFLPTILSRCFIQRLGEKNFLTDLEKKDALSELDNLYASKKGDRLKKAELIGKNKSEASSWLKRALISEHTRILNKDKNFALRLSLLDEAYRVISSTNVNARLVLENYFLALK